MIAIGTKQLSPLLDIFKLPEFIKKHNIKYIETALEYDNDIYLKGKIPKDVSIFTRTPLLKNLDLTLEFHRIALGVTGEQIIPLLSHDTDWEDPETKETVMDLQRLYRLGIDDVQGVEEIENYRNISGWYPEFVSLTMNPLKFPKTILDFCKEHGIKTISHGIFGGEVWAGYLRAMFPDEFLYDFSHYNSSVSVVSGENLHFLASLVNRKKHDSPLMTYSKDISKLPALKIPPRKIHGDLQELNLGELGKVMIPDTTHFTLTRQEIQVEVKDILWEDQLPEDTPPELYGTLHRYHAPTWIDENYNPGWWRKVYNKITDDFWTIKLIPKHWWIFREHFFWLVSGKLIKTPLNPPDNLIGV